MKIRISGAITGEMWMPQVRGGRYIAQDIEDTRARIGPGRASIERTLLSILRQEGGDFQNALFTADTEIIFEFYSRPKFCANCGHKFEHKAVSVANSCPECGGPRTGYLYHIRSRRLDECPSVAHLVDPDVETCDLETEAVE